MKRGEPTVRRQVSREWNMSADTRTYWERSEHVTPLRSKNAVLVYNSIWKKNIWIF